MSVRTKRLAMKKTFEYSHLSIYIYIYNRKYVLMCVCVYACMHVCDCVRPCVLRGVLESKGELISENLRF